MPGPAKKPNPFKVISGTTRPDRKVEEEIVDESPALEETPAPPDWLVNAFAVKEWQRLAPMLVQNRMLRPTDLTTLAHLCSIHGELCKLWSAGMAPTGHMLAQYAKYAQAFGLAYAWRRNKGNESGKKDQKTGFAKFKPPPAG